ncbi:hypothetical protein D3791_10650 [Glutamicibacter mishrai]|uniref:HK97 gp10 family phage protein n=2 Tax=Glutamicibacter mishrai TaxID=1775880 RepID=A0A6H0SJG3_9MICC|nr:hypothetical protein D3791_10650 [Glutamicibacter mishrai]
MARKLKFNQKVFEEIRKLPAVREDLKRRAENIAAAAGGEAMGYKVTELVLEDPRGAVSVMATGHAHFHNRKNHALIRALDAGRD